MTTEVKLVPYSPPISFLSYPKPENFGQKGESQRRITFRNSFRGIALCMENPFFLYTAMTVCMENPFFSHTAMTVCTKNPFFTHTATTVCTKNYGFLNTGVTVKPFIKEKSTIKSNYTINIDRK